MVLVIIIWQWKKKYFNLSLRVRSTLYFFNLINVYCTEIKNWKLSFQIIKVTRNIREYTDPTRQSHLEKFLHVCSSAISTCVSVSPAAIHPAVLITDSRVL